MRLLLSLLVGAVVAASVVAPLPTSSADAANAPRWLIVGGGPSPRHNQVSIESNVRYVERMLPRTAERHVLFADGARSSPTVLYRDPRSGDVRFRSTTLTTLDGAAQHESLDAVWAELASSSEATHPLVLYFTGHGRPDAASHLANNHFLLWGGESLRVTELAQLIAGLPAETPVVLVMVQCFSGSFGNVIFTDGDPARGLAPRPVVGFFSATESRPSAGCTPELDEGSYDEFTGHFFAALAGEDRLGRAVGGADYNHDGHVGMDEAYAYAIIESDSIDVPVATTDVFLRHFVDMADDEVLAARYDDLHAIATPAQQAALDALSRQLGLSGDARVREAYDAWRETRGRRGSERDAIINAKRLRLVRLAKSALLAEKLRTSGDDEPLARFERLQSDESTNPLHPESREPLSRR